MTNENNQEGTIVGANVKLQGTIADDNDIIVHGTVEGEIISKKDINITPSASVTGPVRGQNVTLAGSVDGDVVSAEKTEVLPTGKINGSISAKELIIQSGAIFNGRCQMTEEVSREEEKSPPKKEKPKKKEERQEPKKEEPKKEESKKEEPIEEKSEALELDDFELE
jgi:cytoskeletal protein CcmA (bactofilin family)